MIASDKGHLAVVEQLLARHARVDLGNTVSMCFDVLWCILSITGSRDCVVVWMDSTLFCCSKWSFVGTCIAVEARCTG